MNEIEEARVLLERAERETDPELKANALEEAIDLLDSCTVEDFSDDERILATNLRRAHTRRLLTQLVTLETVNVHIWLKYIKLLFLRLESEVEFALAANPELQERYNHFTHLWRDELLVVFGEE